MFGRRIKPPSERKEAPKTLLGKKGTTPSVLSGGLHILGNLISDGIIDLDGSVDGNIKCQTVHIRENAHVRGDVEAEIIHVYGAVEGIIRGKTVNLYHSAKVVGIIMHEALSIEDGAFVDGKFKRTDKVFIDADTQEIHDAARAENLAFHAEFDDEPASADEVRVLETLRLVR